MNFESTNVVSLNDWRYRTIAPALPPRRKRSPIVTAAGAILVVSSAGFGGYVSYAALQLGALTDLVVLGMLGALGAYLLMGLTLLSGVYRLLLPSRRSDSAAVETRVQQAKAKGEPGVVIKFPDATKTSESVLMWVRCRFCHAPFQAGGARDECPSCGRMAAA